MRHVEESCTIEVFRRHAHRPRVPGKIAGCAALGFPFVMDAVDTLADRSIKELLEKQAITELVYAYSRAVDRRDFDWIERLYTEDGIDDHAGLYAGPAKGFVAWLRGALETVDATSHQVHNLMIAVEGRYAEGEVYLTALNRLPKEDGGFEELVQGLRYLDRYRKDEGRWLFEHRIVVCDWAELRPAFWDLTHPLLSGKRFGRADRDDPSHGTLRSPFFVGRPGAKRASE
jgi:ketosteroid isomerase-like protein